MSLIYNNKYINKSSKSFLTHTHTHKLFFTTRKNTYVAHVQRRGDCPPLKTKIWFIWKM